MEGSFFDPRFIDIFRRPSIEALLQLTPTEFERFIQYTFNCAGYRTVHVATVRFPQGPGVDLDVYNEGFGQPFARVEVRRINPNYRIGIDDVARLFGMLHLAGGIPGYLVTTTTFARDVPEAVSRANGMIRLIDGPHLIRYITYLSGLLIEDIPEPHPYPISPDYIIQADSIELRDTAISTVIGVVNNKGGVAKTTTALNIGFALAKDGDDVLFIDLDGQKSLSRVLLPDAYAHADALPPSSLIDYIKMRAELKDIVLSSHVASNIFLVPARSSMIHMFQGGVAFPKEELRFREALHDLRLVSPNGRPFRWIILDTPPNQGVLTRMACASAHYILIPAASESFAIDGAMQAFITVQTVNALTDGKRLPLGGVISRWGGTANEQKNRRTLELEMAQAHVKMALVEDKTQFLTIPDDPRIERAHLQILDGSSRTLFDIGNGPGPAAKAYLQLVKEIKQHVSESYGETA